MKNLKLFLVLGAIFMICKADSCNNKAVSSSGATKAITKIQLGLNGNTVEQDQIIDFIATSNQPGAIRHLYVISPYTGDVLIYSPVKGKVTSGGKRLSPSKSTETSGFLVPLPDGNSYYTTEVLDDNGVYGSSSEYIYWKDTKGGQHQHFLTGGQIVHVSNEPLAIRKAVINVESNEINFEPKKDK